jgi:NADH oxidase (H2O2-forming)
MSKRIIVIGSGAAGLTAASTARRVDPEASITVVTEDEHIAYSPCVIPWVLEGVGGWDSIVMHSPAFYKDERGIDVMIQTKVTGVDDERKVLVTEGGELPYDSLVIATGGTVFVPPIPGKDLPGVFSVRTINDGKRIQEWMGEVDSVSIVGAGVIGLEMALAMRHMGKKVSVIEMFPQVVPRILDADLAEMVQSYLEGQGVEFVMGAPIASVDGDGKVEAVTVGGRRIDCGMVIMATGVRANLEVPRMLELDIGELGAVRASPSMQPYRKGRLVRNVYMAGDVVMCESGVVPGPTMSQLGSSAVRQGIVAGTNAAGGSAMHPGVVSPWVSVIGDMQVAGTGLSKGLAEYYGIDVVEGVAQGYTRARYYPGGKKLVVKVLVERSSHRMVGAQIVSGEEATGRINWLTAAIVTGTTVEDFATYFENAYCPPTSMVRDVALNAADRAAEKL